MWDPGDELVNLRKLLEKFANKFSNSFWRFASSSSRSHILSLGQPLYYLVQTGPAFCQRESQRSRLPRFDPAGTALGGRHNSAMVSPEHCGAGGLTNCLRLPLLLDGPIL